MATFPSHSHTGERPVALEKISGLPLQVVIIFLITAIAGFVQLEYQIEKKSLLEEHRKIVVAIFVTLSLYALGSMAEYKLGSGTNDFKLRIIKRFSPLFGILDVVLLLTISAPFLGAAAIILWGLFMLDAIIKTVKETLQWIRQGILGIRDIIINYFGSGGEGI